MLAVICAGGLSACERGNYVENIFSPSSDEHPYTPSSWKYVVAHYPAYLDGIHGTAWQVQAHDPSGLFIGKPATVTVKGSGAAACLLHKLSHAVPKASIEEITPAQDTGTFSASGFVRLKGADSSGVLCLAYHARSVAGRADQLWKGRFTIVGGRGRLARLHGTGRVLVLQPNVLKSYDRPFPLWGQSTFTQLSLGRPQRYTSACTKAITQPPPPKTPKTVSATFQGFTLAPSSVRHTHELPASATVYPSGGSVTGPSTCSADNDLYAVIDYSGPKGGKFEGYLTAPISQNLSPGRNVVFLEAAPPDGEVSLKGDVSAPSKSGILVTANLELQRNC